MNTTHEDKQNSVHATQARTANEPNTATLVQPSAAAPATQSKDTAIGTTGTMESPQLAADRQRLLREEQTRIDQEKQAALARERELARFD